MTRKQGYDPIDYLNELYRRDRAKKPKDSQLLDLCFPKQRAAVESEARRQTWVCGRRSGKTTGIVIKHLLTAERFPRSITAYCALTRPTAKRLVWGLLKQIDAQLRLGYEFNESELVATAPTGGQIWLIGAQKDDEREKMRGNAFRGVTLDEAGSYGEWLEPFIREIIEPALLDYTGWLVMTGTPPPNMAGAFYEADQGEWREYERHHWNMLDNECMPAWAETENWRQQAEKLFQDTLDKYGWTPEHPTFVREYLGRWCNDSTSRVYAFRPDRNVEVPPEHPSREWDYYWGIDLGFNDSTAVCVWGWHPSSPNLYEIFSYSDDQCSTDKLGKLLVELRKLYPPKVAVADSGGLGKLILEDLRLRYGVFLQPASKGDKPGHIKLFNSDLERGLIKVRPDSPVIQQWLTLPWDIDSYGKLEDSRFPNDDADARLYGWRAARHYFWNPPEIAPERSIDEEMDEYWQKKQRQFRPRRKGAR